VHPQDLNIVFDSLSAPRISSYRNYFGGHLTDRQIFGCYQWNESVSQAFFKVITLVEIVMRNKMHTSLSQQYYGTQKKVVSDRRPHNWNYINTTTIGAANSCNWYETGCLPKKSQSKVHAKTHHHRNGSRLQGARRPSPDDVISSLTFGFWSSLVDKCPNIQWDQILGDIFPKHRATGSNQWGVITHRKRLTYRLELVRDFRNRIAHHEPLWKLPDILDETPPTNGGQRAVQFPATTTPQESITRLRAIYSKHTELLRWLSPEIHRDLKESTHHQHLLWLCSIDGLDAHLNRSEALPISMKPSRFKRELLSVIKNKKTTYLHMKGKNIMSTFPIN
jgi:hypothetical protein